MIRDIVNDQFSIYDGTEEAYKSKAVARQTMKKAPSKVVWKPSNFAPLLDQYIKKTKKQLFTNFLAGKSHLIPLGMEVFDVPAPIPLPNVALPVNNPGNPLGPLNQLIPPANPVPLGQVEAKWRIRSQSLVSDDDDSVDTERELDNHENDYMDEKHMVDKLQEPSSGVIETLNFFNRPHVPESKDIVPPLVDAPVQYSVPGEIKINRPIDNQSLHTNASIAVPEKITAERRQQGVTQYLIKWVGYINEFNTWEPASKWDFSDYDALRKQWTTVGKPAWISAKRRRAKRPRH